MSSPVLLQDIVSLRRAQAEATKAGMDLVDYLTQQSEEQIDQQVEDHVKELQAQYEKAMEEQDKAFQEALKETEEAQAEKENESKGGSKTDCDDSEEEEGKDEEEEEEKEEDEDTEGEEDEAEEEEGESEDEDEEDEGSSSDTESSSDEENEEEEEEDKAGGEKDEKIKGILKTARTAEDLAKLVVDGKANSVTHKKQWDTFSRQILDRKKFPASLASHVLKGRTDVFNAWLQCSQDWSKVELAYTRKSSDIREVKRGRGGLKKRDILLKYPSPKGEDLCKRLRERGLWEWDEDFPQDEEEPQEFRTTWTMEHVEKKGFCFQ